MKIEHCFVNGSKNFIVEVDKEMVKEMISTFEHLLDVACGTSQYDRVTELSNSREQLINSLKENDDEPLQH